MELICFLKSAKGCPYKTKEEIIENPIIRLNLIGKSEKGVKDISKIKNNTGQMDVGYQPSCSSLIKNFFLSKPIQSTTNLKKG